MMRSTAISAGLDQQAAADTLLTQMARIRRAGRRHSGRPAELSLLTGAQLELVRLVRRRPGVSVAEAAQELTLAANTVSTLVRQLTEAGMLVRSVDQADRRIARLQLSAAISDKVDAWRDRRMVALAEALAELPDEQQRQFAGALALLTRVADRLEAPAAP
jgi:DNA-binding MarR family transcriptional regulator